MLMSYLRQPKTFDNCALAKLEKVNQEKLCIIKDRNFTALFQILCVKVETSRLVVSRLKCII